MENDNVCCLGKVYGPEDESLLLQSKFYEKKDQVLDNEITLSKDDIYKDLRVRGYDYSGEFQKLREIRTNNFLDMLGECEWDGNMVTFLDNLLQAQIMATPFRKLMLPVGIKYMRIDAKVLYETVRSNKLDTSSKPGELEEFSMKNQMDENRDKFLGEVEQITGIFNERFVMFKSSVPFYFNANTKILVAPGVEIEQVVALPIPRKIQTALNLDSYEWVANEDNSAINECDKQSINEYLKV